MEDAAGADSVSYEVRTHNRLIHMIVTGCLKRTDLPGMNETFWNARKSEHDLALMDFRGVSRVDISVKEFAASGMSEQAGYGPPPEDQIRAAYVASNPVTYGFVRVIKGVWDRYADIEVFQSLPDALAWLGLAEDDLRA